MKIIKLTDETEQQLKDWLLGRESDIAYSIEDLGQLQDVFVEVIGRESQQ